MHIHGHVGTCRGVSIRPAMVGCISSAHFRHRGGCLRRDRGGRTSVGRMLYAPTRHVE